MSAMTKRSDETSYLDNLKKFKSDIDDAKISEVETAFQFLVDKCKFKESLFPPILLVHQLYTVIKDKTKVDQEVAKLQNEKKIVLFKLGLDKDDINIAICLTKSLINHVTKVSTSKVAHQYARTILPSIKRFVIDKLALRTTFSVSDAEVKELVQEGLLVIKDPGIYSLSFPGAGDFTSVYLLGRKTVLRIIQRAKFSEIHENELRKKNFPAKALLGIDFHILDCIGSDSVTCITSNTGTTLRYKA